MPVEDFTSLAACIGVDLVKRGLMLRLDNKDLDDTTKPGLTVRQAQRMQMAAMLAVLIHLPLRIKNVAALDVHIKPPAGGSDGRWLVHFVEGEVKNKVVIDGLFNETVSALLQRYVAVFCPILLKKPSSKLFVSRNGTGKDLHTLSRQFRSLIKRELGLAMNAHLMRHWAGFVYLENRPDDYETVRRLLGHKNIATTIRLYTGAETKSAHHLYDQTIAAHLDPAPMKFVKVRVSTWRQGHCTVSIPRTSCDDEAAPARPQG